VACRREVLLPVAAVCQGMGSCACGQASCAPKSTSLGLCLAAADARRGGSPDRLCWHTHCLPARYSLCREPGGWGKRVKCQFQNRQGHVTYQLPAARVGRVASNQVYNPQPVNPPSASPTPRSPQVQETLDASALVRHPLGRVVVTLGLGVGAHSNSVTAAMTAFRFPDELCLRSLKGSPLRRISPLSLSVQVVTSASHRFLRSGECVQGQRSPPCAARLAERSRPTSPFPYPHAWGWPVRSPRWLRNHGYRGSAALCGHGAGLTPSLVRHVSHRGDVSLRKRRVHFGTGKRLGAYGVVRVSEPRERPVIRPHL
jgi:hypothetical protein